jgi:hypothetical protein
MAITAPTENRNKVMRIQELLELDWIEGGTPIILGSGQSCFRRQTVACCPFSRMKRRNGSLRQPFFGRLPHIGRMSEFQHILALLPDSRSQNQ